MPLYEYLCPDCGYLKEFIRPVKYRDIPIDCPECGTPSDRVEVPSGAPIAIFKGEGWTPKCHHGIANKGGLIAKNQ